MGNLRRAMAMRWSAVAAGVAATFLAVAAARADAPAAQLVVVEARGIALTPGEAIDPTKPVVLKPDQFVVLMSPTGQTIKLTGPYDKAPGGDGGGGKAEVGAALTALVTQKLASSESLGVVRGANADPIPPQPWLVNVTHVGNRCLEVGKPITLWRDRSDATIPLTVTPFDHSWRANATWAAGDDRLTLPSTVPISRRASYMVKAGNQTVAITIIAIPATVDNDAMRASWMIEAGCTAQAVALLRSLGQKVDVRQR